MERPRFWLALIVFLAIISLGHAWHGSIDAIQRLELTRSLSFNASAQTKTYGAIKYAPLQSVIMLPSYVAGHAAARAFAATDDDAHFFAYRLTATLYGAAITALIAVVFFDLLLLLAFDVHIAIASTYVLVMGTLLLPYSRIMFSEIISAALLLISCRLMAGDRGGMRRAVAVASVLGLLCMNGLIFAPLAIVLMTGWSIARARQRGTREGLATIAVAAGVAAIVLALWAWYNVARFGNPWTTGYEAEGFTTPVVTGLYGLTISIGRGMVLYSLPTALGAVALFAYRGRLGAARVPILLHAVGALGYLLIYSTWGSFEGGWAWGPRFLLTFVPVWHVGFALALDRARGWSTAGRVALAATALFGIAINSYEYMEVYRDYEAHIDPRDYMRTVFEPAFASLFHNWDARVFAKRFPQFAAVAIALWFALRAYGARLSGDALSRYHSRP